MSYKGEYHEIGPHLTSWDTKRQNMSNLLGKCLFFTIQQQYKQQYHRMEFSFAFNETDRHMLLHHAVHLSREWRNV